MITNIKLRAKLTMDCKVVLLLLPTYYDKQLSKSDSEELEKHLQTCTACSKEFSKIEKLANALTVVSGAELPFALAQELHSIIGRPTIKQLTLKSIRLCIARRRTFYNYVDKAAYFAILTIIVVSIIKVDGYLRQRQEPDYGSEEKTPTVETKGSGFQLPLPMKKPAKRKPVEPGVEGQHAVSGEPSELTPQPEVSISNKNYSSDDVDDAVAKPCVLNFSSTYTAAEVSQIQDKLIIKIADRAKQLGEDGETARQCIKIALARLGKPALPAYIERARFNNKDAWLVVLVWGDNESSAHLSTVSVFVVDAAQKIILFTQLDK